MTSIARYQLTRTTFLRAKRSKSAEQDITAFKSHIQKLIAEIRSADIIGIILLTDNFRKIPKVDGKIKDRYKRLDQKTCHMQILTALTGSACMENFNPFHSLIVSQISLDCPHRVGQAKREQRLAEKQTRTL